MTDGESQSEIWDLHCRLSSLSRFHQITLTLSPSRRLHLLTRQMTVRDFHFNFSHTSMLLILDRRKSTSCSANEINDKRFVVINYTVCSIWMISDFLSIQLRSLLPHDLPSPPPCDACRTSPMLFCCWRRK